jgi:hypothetical protein
MDGYVRKTLEHEQHEQDCNMWKSELDAFQKENPSFDPLYGKVIKKRKRKETTKSLICKKMKFTMKWICMNKAARFVFPHIHSLLPHVPPRLQIKLYENVCNAP